MARFTPGLELIRLGKCPLRARSPVACWACSYGHASECHYPDTCAEAQCSHYERETEAKEQLNEDHD